jgi:hypothetical protein
MCCSVSDGQYRAAGLIDGMYCQSPRRFEGDLESTQDCWRAQTTSYVTFSCRREQTLTPTPAFERYFDH